MEAPENLNCPEERRKTRLFVRGIRNGSIIVCVDLSDSVAHVKRLIKQKENIDCNAYSLMFAGKILSDNSTLSSYNLQPISILHAVFRHSAGQTPLSPAVHPKAAHAIRLGLPARPTLNLPKPNTNQSNVRSGMGKCSTGDLNENGNDLELLKLNVEQRGVVEALHETLKSEYHDIFTASEDPYASPALVDLASRYATPARMWAHGIGNFPMPWHDYGGSRGPSKTTLIKTPQQSHGVSTNYRKIQVKFVGGDRRSPLSLTICISDTVAQFKSTLACKEDLANEIYLLYSGTLLRDDSSLSNYNIKHLSTLVAVLPYSTNGWIGQHPKRIYLQGATGESLQVFFNWSEKASIRLIKERIYLSHGIPIEVQRLFFQGVLLKDEVEFLRSYGIQTDDKIDLLVNLPYYRSVLTKHLDGESTSTIFVKDIREATTTSLQLALPACPKDIKALIHISTGIKSSRQQLVFAGRILQDNESLLASGIRDRSTILVIRKGLSILDLPQVHGASDKFWEMNLDTDLELDPDFAAPCILPWRVSHEGQEAWSSLDRKSPLLSDIEGSSNRTAFATARTRPTNAPSEYMSIISDTSFVKALKERNLLPTLEEEVNWSGRGQHVEFVKSEAIPLEFGPVLGSSYTAVVQQVSRRKIKMALKIIKCTRKLPLAAALTEVEHLYRFRDPHIIQLVGSYLQGKTFGILLYPVADWNLKTFMEEEDVLADERNSSLMQFFGCLTHAVKYIHVHTTRHMDIKPQNLLVKRVACSKSGNNSYRVYLADFDIALNFRDEDASQTDSPRKSTPMYRAPEVYNNEPKGRASDIFSLGCVFLEMCTVLVGRSLADFEKFRRSETTSAFHANLPQVRLWMEHISEHSGVLGGLQCTSSNFAMHLGVVERMVEECPAKRPTASEVATHFEPNRCCFKEREGYCVEG